MNEKRVKTGIVGCGKIAQSHAAALAKLPNSEFVVCCDSDESRASALAGEFGVAMSCCELDDLLKCGVEAVMVCTPHPVHEEIVVRAAEAGVHPLCEKPVATELDQVDRMIAAADNASVNFGVIFQRRFWPAAQRIRAAIDSDQIGWPTMGLSQSWLWRPETYFAQDPWRGKWATEGGGVLMNQAVHVIDLLQWFMGPVTEVYGKHATLIHGAYIDVEDTAVATLAFESGALGVIQAATTVNPPFGFKVSIHGSTGDTLSVLEDPEGTQGINDIWTLDPEDKQRRIWEAIEKGNPGFPTFHQLQIEDFLNSILENRPPAVTGAESRKSLAIILAIYESQRTGKRVMLKS